MTAPGPSGDPVRAVYLGTDPDATLALLHLPASAPSSDVGVLLCPPFGWDDVCSYRSRRAWSYALAEAGHPSARIDLPGTGDSGGSPRTPGRVTAWTDAVSMAARWLRDQTGCGRIAAIGIGLGGLVAYAALARDAEINDLILWAVPSRGRALVRELRASALIGREKQGERGPSPPAGDDEALEVNGFVMTRETLGALEELDLAQLVLPDPAQRRVLLLGRDGLAPESRLREHLERAGATVSIAHGRGYGQMMQEPRFAKPPLEVFAQTISWLGGTPRLARTPRLAGTPPGSARLGEPASPSAAPRPATTLELLIEGRAVRETPLSLRVGAQQLFGILSEPAAGSLEPVTAILFSAGGVRRIGPNRIWVEVARSWAARGVSTLRVDLTAMGDADGDERPFVSNAAYYTPDLIEQALSVLEAVAARDLPSRFILGGLCSGDYLAFRGALVDERVIGAVMVNLGAFAWSEEGAAERALRNATAVRRGRFADTWTVQNVRETAPRVLRTSLRRRKGRIRRAQETVMYLDRLHDRGTELLLQFSADEGLYEDLVRDGHLAQLDRWPNLRVELIPSVDHTFRALPLQAQVRRGVDDALARALERIPASESTEGGREPSAEPVTEPDVNRA